MLVFNFNSLLSEKLSHLIAEKSLFKLSYTCSGNVSSDVSKRLRSISRFI